MINTNYISSECHDIFILFNHEISFVPQILILLHFFVWITGIYHLKRLVHYFLSVHRQVTQAFNIVDGFQKFVRFFVLQICINYHWVKKCECFNCSKAVLNHKVWPFRKKLSSQISAIIRIASNFENEVLDDKFWISLQDKVDELRTLLKIFLFD